jgi:hypothetical protein
MRHGIDLSDLLASIDGDVPSRLGLFALLGLGMIESLANGALSANDATRLFFHAQNCLYVRKRLRAKLADEFMSHGVQLQDLFEALAEQEAQREFQHELAVMRALCLRLLDQHRAVA